MYGRCATSPLTLPSPPSGARVTRIPLPLRGEGAVRADPLASSGEARAEIVRADPLASSGEARAEIVRADPLASSGEARAEIVRADSLAASGEARAEIVGGVRPARAVTRGRCSLAC